MKLILVCLLWGALSPSVWAASVDPSDPNLKFDKEKTEGRVLECQSCEFKNTPAILLHDSSSKAVADKQPAPVQTHAGTPVSEKPQVLPGKNE